MGTIGKGSKIKCTIALDENSLGGKSLSEVEYKIDFYARLKRDSVVTGMYTVRSSDNPATTVVSGMNIIAPCDTSNLDLGQLYATLTVVYTDADLSQKLREVQTLLCDGVIIVDAPLSSDDTEEIPKEGDTQDDSPTEEEEEPVDEEAPEEETT